jgi:SAM-dependent methyltransferase
VVLRALVSDVAQRVLTLNKREQRRELASRVRQLELPPGAAILDFGCGTGLFARTLQRCGLMYHGYDPDAAAIRYARRLYPDLTFTAGLEEAAAAAPYDLVLANCCFHHIPDGDLLQTTLPAIMRLMRPGSIFLLYDVLPLDRGASPVRRLYNILEQGTAKRTGAELERLLAGRFAVRSRRVQRSFAFSAAAALNPIYNDLILYELVLA